MPCDLPSAQSRSARGHQADSLSGKRLPYSGGQWLCCLWQKGPFLRWVQFLIEQKNSKNFTSGCFESSPPWKLIVLHQQCWSESISAPDILGLYCPLLFWNIFAFFFFLNLFSGLPVVEMCKRFVQVLLYFLFSFVCFCFMTRFSAHLCLQLRWWWSRDLFSPASVCLQRVQCVCGWWEDGLLTDELSCTTVVIWMFTVFHILVLVFFSEGKWTNLFHTQFKWLVSTDLVSFTFIVYSLIFSLHIEPDLPQ